MFHDRLKELVELIGCLEIRDNAVAYQQSPASSRPSDPLFGSRVVVERLHGCAGHEGREILRKGSSGHAVATLERAGQGDVHERTACRLPGLKLDRGCRHACCEGQDDG